MCLRPACHNCKYANTERPSDITIGDFWGIEKSHGGFEDDLGISPVQVNTPKGKGLFDKAADNLEYIETALEDCSKYQGNLTKPTRPNPKRDAFWQDYRNRGFEFILRKYSSYGLVRRVRLVIFTLLVKTKLLDTIKKIIKRG
jgi:coenzyme F420-reducing hydrogenase beta subunit